MSPKSSDLPSNAKETILRQMREQFGSNQYEQLVNNYGEDGLIDLALDAMAQNNASRPGLKKMGRFGGSIVGFVMGVVVGSIFLGAGWLLNTVLSVPFGYSLAALTNGAVITVPTSIFLASLRKKEKESIDFRTVFLYYILASLVGGLMGVGRWLLHMDVSIMGAFVNPLWNMFMSICYPVALCVGLAIVVGAWVISLGNCAYSLDTVVETTLSPILSPIFLFLLVVSPIALLADAPLWKQGLPLLNQNVLGVTLAVTAGLGGLLGLCWPPVLRETS